MSETCLRSLTTDNTRQARRSLLSVPKDPPPGAEAPSTSTHICRRRQEGTAGQCHPGCQLAREQEHGLSSLKPNSVGAPRQRPLRKWMWTPSQQVHLQGQSLQGRAPPPSEQQLPWETSGPGHLAEPSGFAHGGLRKSSPEAGRRPLRAVLVGPGRQRQQQATAPGRSTAASPCRRGPGLQLHSYQTQRARFKREWGNDTT